MANHVTASLRFERINKAGQEIFNSKLARLQQFAEDEGMNPIHLGYLLSDDLDDIDRGVMIEEFGAKWAYANYWEEGYSLDIESAWEPCSEFVESLVDEIATVDPDVLAVHTYEDECLNFVGVDVYDSSGLDDSNRLEDYDLRDLMFEEIEGLQDVWDEDEEDWTDDGELFQDNVYEFVHNWIEDQIRNVVE